MSVLHDSAIADTIYILPDNASYQDRLKPVATVTVTYIFEGRLADMKTYTGKITPSVFRQIVDLLESKGVKRIEWRRFNTGRERAKAYSIPQRRFVKPLFDLL